MSHTLYIENTHLNTPLSENSEESFDQLYNLVLNLLLLTHPRGVGYTSGIDLIRKQEHE